MRIVFATDVYFPLVGGIQIVTKRLARYLSKSGNEVYIVGPSSSTKDNVVDDEWVKVYGLASLPVPFYSSIRYIPYAHAKKKIFRILEKIKPDIIHIQTNIAIAKSAALYAKKFCIPVIATGHVTNDEVAFAFKSFPPLANLIGKIMASLYKDVWEEAYAITAPSSTTAKYFINKVHIGKKIIPLSNGIDLRKFRIRRPIARSRPVILFVGRLDPIKKVETIIKAMPLILKKIDANLILVGSGTEEEYLKNLAGDLGVSKHVSFAGFVSEKEVVSHLKRASVFVISSAIETQGLAALEAAAAGLPIVASNVGALPELVRNGINGYLFPLSDSSALAGNVIKVLEKRGGADRMGRESVKIAERHDMKRVVAKLERLYKGAIEGNDT